MNSISLASLIAFFGLLAFQRALVNCNATNALFLCNGVEFSLAQAKTQVSYAYTVKLSETWERKQRSRHAVYPLRFNQLGRPWKLNELTRLALYVSNYMVVMDDHDNLMGMVWHHNHDYYHCERIDFEGDDIPLASLASDPEYA
ncbi:CSEP0185 putative effector protein [Blumeria hordei DH14]|uniref:CSEP0185 putative effector protein n=1 Tax=Blumeria graminis f. sp. hordei (strain DH14) TaxID=546991 RepID=N1JNB2_BLUG1|nr:CSEP0185 putative effector protein [Blumeria hordei DH14]